VLPLQTAVTALPDNTLIAHDAALVDADALPTLRLVSQADGSHMVWWGDGAVLMAASAPGSAELFDDLGFDVVAVEIGEFEKIEDRVTCLSALVVRR
jgi:dimethylargininase